MRKITGATFEFSSSTGEKLLLQGTQVTRCCTMGNPATSQIALGQRKADVNSNRCQTVLAEAKLIPWSPDGAGGCGWPGTEQAYTVRQCHFMSHYVVNLFILISDN